MSIKSKRLLESRLTLISPTALVDTNAQLPKCKLISFLFSLLLS